MKFIIRQFLIALALIAIIHVSKCERDRETRKYRLNRVFENIIEKNNKQDERKIENEISRAYDMDCVKKFFKLPENNKMILEEFEEMVFMFASAMKCSDEDKVFDTYIFEEYIHENMGKRLTCLKWHLKQHEPSSKLIENFEVNDNEVKKCKENRMYMEIEELKKSIESILGPLNVYTCGEVSENGGNDFITFISKGAVIKYGNITEELKKSEKEKLKQYFKDISINTVNCNIKRFENDPQGRLYSLFLRLCPLNILSTAFHINDTLNHYYKKELIPIDDEQEDSNDYVKRLIKLEETIDYDCVKEKLNLPENGDLALIEVEATIIIASAKAKCIKVDPVEFSDLFFDFAVEDGQRNAIPFACAKYKLQRLEPTSKLAVTSSSDESRKKHCRHVTISLHPYSIPMWAYTDQVGALSETTCGVMTGEIFDIISLKTMLVFSEKDKNLKINETKELFRFVTDKLHKLADCFLERIR